jgi:hypothetical protein
MYPPNEGESILEKKIRHAEIEDQPRQAISMAVNC